MCRAVRAGMETRSSRHREPVRPGFHADPVHFKKKDNRWYPVVNTTKETLRNAPGYKYDRNAQSWVPEHASGTTGGPNQK